MALDTLELTGDDKNDLARLRVQEFYTKYGGIDWKFRKGVALNLISSAPFYMHYELMRANFGVVGASRVFWYNDWSICEAQGDKIKDEHLEFLEKDEKRTREGFDEVFKREISFFERLFSRSEIEKALRTHPETKCFESYKINNKDSMYVTLDSKSKGRKFIDLWVRKTSETKPEMIEIAPVARCFPFGNFSLDKSEDDYWLLIGDRSGGNTKRTVLRVTGESLEEATEKLYDTAKEYGKKAAERIGARFIEL